MKKSKWRISHIICLILCSFCITSCGNTDSETIKENGVDNFSNMKMDYYIENGYYTVGIDLPPGICNIYATSGTGSILCTADGTIDTYNPVEEDLNQLISINTTDIKEISDYTLKSGYTIHISGAVRICVSFKQITGSYTGRTYDDKNKITLEAGSYTTGNDFEPGVYTIIAIEGNGYLSSSNAFELGIDEMFGVFDGTETYVPKAEHITLNNEDILKISEVTVEMIRIKSE